MSPMSELYMLIGLFGLLAFLVLRNNLRKRRQGNAVSALDAGWFRGLSPWEEGKELSESMKKTFMFWGGALAGITSAGLTHQLDVLKVLRQVGRELPDSVGGYFLGITMGCLAQGARFAVTLLLNATLQKKLASWEKRFKKGTILATLMAFCFSMIAGGIGELLTAPFSVTKNYQIANGCGMWAACVGLWEMGGIWAFFNGVGFAVLRKSMANGIMLQTIGPCKQLLKLASPRWLGSEDPAAKSALGFLAGSLTGAFSEVMTNHPDQVKAMTQIGVPVWEAIVTATRHPFRGAIWAGIRKGGIRGINWGCLEIYMGFFERTYRMYRKMAAYQSNSERISEFTRQLTPI